MLKKWFSRKKKENMAPEYEIGKGTVEIAGRTVQKSVQPMIGATILEMANHHKVDFFSHCKKGTCARCRCFVSEGYDLLSAPNEAELIRLTEEEIDEGYRLGCQAKVVNDGHMKVKHASYF